MRAVTRANDVVLGCRQVTSSWFAQGYPCSVYTYNCYRHGVASPDEAAWTHLDKETLAFLTMAHCPALTIPRTFQSFPNLVGVHLHNVTLVDWSKASGISATKHTRLIALVVTRANMTALPDGVLGPLPASLIDVEFSHTNLTAVPLDLHERWHALATVYFEHSHLTTFPETLLHLGASEFSLHSNRIERLPAALPPDLYFFIFVLSGNPIRELPADVGRGTVLSFVSLEHTLIATLPSWVQTNVESTVFLHNTPYCAATQARDAFDGANLLCLSRDSRVDGKVPLYVIDPGLPV